MENEILHTTEFREHYGRFPYIIHRLYPALYKQMPIHFSEYHEPGVLPGLTVRIDRSKWEGHEVLQSEAMREFLIKFLHKFKREMDEKCKRDQHVCLVFGPTDCHYLSPEKEFASSSPPSGGTLCGNDGKPMMMNPKYHWRESGHEPIFHRID